MKKFKLVGLAMFIAGSSFGQTPYVCTADKSHPGGLILNGIISKYILENMDAFSWYNSSRSSYSPDSSIIHAMESAKGRYQFLVFGGTWCEDTQFVLPKFFKLQELAGYPDSGIGFFGVDRAKSTIGNFAEVFGVKNVPTIIVMKDGKEKGRVVEYGKTGKWDQELADLLK